MNNLKVCTDSSLILFLTMFLSITLCSLFLLVFLVLGPMAMARNMESPLLNMCCDKSTPIPSNITHTTVPM